MKSRTRATAAGYHRATSYRRHRLTPHAMDWNNQPTFTKPYPKLPRVALEKDLDLPEIDYFKHVLRPRDASRPAVSMDIEQLSGALYLTHAVTARSMHAGQPFYYRSVASAGALYPFELYLAVHHVDGLNPGLYHFEPLTFSLTVLRQGHQPVVPPAGSSVAATFYVSGIFFRSAWKYRSRAYRYVLLDAGHLLENLRLALGALNHAFSIGLDFDDDQAATFLGVDSEREVCLAAVHLHAGSSADLPGNTAGGLEPLATDIREASRVAGREVAYPEILDIHRAGSPSGDRAIETLAGFAIAARQSEVWIDLDDAPLTAAADYVRVLRQRRSRRNFIPAAVSTESFTTFLKAMGAGMGPGAGMPAAYRSALTVGILVGENMLVSAGFYLLDPESQRLGRIARGTFIESMASACLDQMWLKHAGVHLLLMTDTKALDRAWGARGYRYAMIEAGRLGQQAYLAATALGWGACGIGAIYDREAADLIGLADSGALLYLIGIGPVKTR